MLRHLLDWLKNTDLVVLVGLLVVVLSVWGFIALADEVLTGQTQRLDERIIATLRDPDDPARPRGPPWLQDAGRDVTALGSPVVLTLVIGAVIGFLGFHRSYNALLLVLGATLGGLALSTLLKGLIDRPRPAGIAPSLFVSTASFPSGHTMLAAVVYLTLGALLTRLVERRRLKLYLLGISLLVTFLVGLSRVYLGVHFPSDVLAGWSLGLAWSIACWLAARYLCQRGAVESIGE